MFRGHPVAQQPPLEEEPPAPMHCDAKAWQSFRVCPVQFEVADPEGVVQIITNTGFPCDEQMSGSGCAVPVGPNV